MGVVDCTPGHKTRSIKAWLDDFDVEALATFRIILKGDYEPGPLIQHQHLLSQMLFWMNGHKFQHTLPVLVESLHKKVEAVRAPNVGTNCVIIGFKWDVVKVPVDQVCQTQPS